MWGSKYLASQGIPVQGLHEKKFYSRPVYKKLAHFDGTIDFLKYFGPDETLTVP
jgi:hypothetical protein